MPEDMDAKRVNPTAVAETVDVFIFLLPRAVSDADSQYFTLPLLVQQTPMDFRRTLPFPTDSADRPLEVHRVRWT